MCVYTICVFFLFFVSVRRDTDVSPNAAPADLKKELLVS